MSDVHGPAAMPRLDLPPVPPAATSDVPLSRARTVEDLVAAVRVDPDDLTSAQPEPPAPAPAESVVPEVATYGWNPGLPG